jgi:hypothetical protein
MIEDTIGYNSTYISLNLLDELDYYLGGYGKPNIEFLFTLNTFVESFIGSSAFYTSLDELNHLNLTAPALFPNGRPILNLVVREGGLKFVNGVVDNPANEIYRDQTSNRPRKEAQQDFVIEYGSTIHGKYFIKSDISKSVERIPLITSKFEDDYFIVSEILSTSDELISNLMSVSKTSSIQTTLPIYLYGRQLDSLNKTPYSIESLQHIAKLHETNLDELVKSLKFQYLPIPPFTSILLSQVNSISEIPQKLSQLRADFQDLRTKFVELEQDIYESSNIKQQHEAYKKFKEFWSTFNKKYVDKRHRIFWGSLDISEGAEIDKAADTLFDTGNISEAAKDLNMGKIAGNIISKTLNWNKDRKIINRFKGLTNIWELFQESKGITQQVNHFERLFSVKYSTTEINNVHTFVKTKIKDLTTTIEN